MSSSGAEMPPQQSQPSDQTQVQNRSFSIFFPFILGLSAPAMPAQDQQELEHGTVAERVVLINPFMGSLIMIQGSGQDLSSKDGPLPASKASIEAMPEVKITEEGLECAICLGEYEVGGEAKEMPCKHRYHPDCIDKWLGIHGSCPVCRYRMPVEEGEENKKGSDGGEGGNGGRRGEGEIVISFSFGGGDRRNSGSSPANSSPSHGRSDDDGVATDDGSPTQDMEAHRG